MIELCKSEDSVTVLRSTLLSQVLVPHGFSVRSDGEVNQPMVKAIGCEGMLRCWVRQVHGGCVKQITQTTATEHEDADALMTNEADVVLSVQVADCVPVLMANRTGQAVAAVHAGWRGIIADVIGRSIAGMREAFDMEGRDVVAAIGPCIGRDHFEVGDEVADAFDEAGLSSAVIRNHGCKPHIDLVVAATCRLRAAGVPIESIDRSDYCTYRDQELFHSYRRDGEQAGRMVAMIATKC